MTAWQPSDETIKNSNLYALMKEQARTVAEIHAWSVNQPEAFWERTIRVLGIKFRKPYAKILDLSDGVQKAHWLAGAELNIAESCFSASPEAKAIISRRVDGSTLTLTYRQLDALSNRIANSLVALGLKKGDAVALDMSMTGEGVALYLGIVKAGLAAISIPESFATEEIEKRLRLGQAKLVCTQDELVRGTKRLPIYEKVAKANAPRTIVFGEGKLPLRAGDMWWNDFLGTNEKFEAVICQPEDTINILFSSGTTGDPKCIPWNHTTPLKPGCSALYHHDLKAGDVTCWPTSLGWMMGPWVIFATFLNKATLAIYEGAPVERGFCEFVQEVKVTMLGLVPSIVKGWMSTDCAKGLNWSSIRTFSSSGEASNAKDYAWLMQLNQPAGTLKPVIEYCGGTEIGGAYIANNLLTPQNPGEFNGKAMGSDFVVLNENGEPSKPGEAGEVFIIPPGIGLSIRLLNTDNDKVYYEGTPTLNGKKLRRHGDRIIVLGENRFQSDGRADNTMNLGGIKVGSAEIERAVAIVPGVIETAAIGIPPAEGGPDRLIIFTVAKPEGRDTMKPAMQKAIKESLNPLFHLHEIVFIESLPRTASNKVMHRELRDKYRKEEAERKRA